MLSYSLDKLINSFSLATSALRVAYPRLLFLFYRGAMRFFFFP